MKKILIVEDDRDLVEILELHLKKHGYEVDHAYDGEKALEKVKEFNPDLIILDIMLPKLDGHVFNQQIKSDFKTKNIPIIAISGKIGVKEILMAENQLTVSAFFYKPVQTSVLIQEIKKLLRE
ncbi:MAG: response regulator [Endomicrobia bacterium]|nr:response regulator [Endomicrobiia bacterium]